MYGIRFIPKYTICLDIFLDWAKRINGVKKKDSLVPLLREYEEGINEEAPKKQSNIFVYVSFFLAGIALNLTWGAISFIVPFWIDKYGTDVWRDFVVCYNFPGFPILLLQLWTDEKTSKYLGTRKTYLIRLVFSFAFVAALGAFVPFAIQSGAGKTTMLIFVTLVGAAVGLGHGWIYSIVSLYPPLSVSYLAAGGGMATVVLLGLTLAENFPIDQSLSQLNLYFQPVCFISVVGIFCIVALLYSTNSKVILSRVDTELSVVEPVEKHGLLMKDEEPAAVEPEGHIVKAIWSPLASIFVTIFSIVAAVTLIANVPSATGNPKFPSYILYVTSILGFVGSEVAVFLKWVARPWPLFVFSLLRMILFVFLLFYSVKQFWLNDTFILIILGIFASTGAFCISKCYSLCSASVSLRQQASASNWLNILLYVGVYAGLAFPYLFPYIAEAIQ